MTAGWRTLTCAMTVVLAGFFAVPTALALPSPQDVALPPKCAPVPRAGQPVRAAVGVVACQELTTHLLGPGISAPFEYFIPPACAATRETRCPTLYLLHGFGGDYTEMLGRPGTTTSAWVAALTHAPPAGFEQSPWTHADPSRWNPASPLAVILVAPLGQTLPGGYGPGPGHDSYWVDWNPKYASRYGTPPPRFASFLTHELAPFVEDHFPAGSGRDWRAIAGVSLGGYGAYKSGLQHPDEWSTMISVSGAHNFLFGPAPQPTGPSLPLGPPAPLPITYSPLPAPTGLLPRGVAPAQAGTFTTALDALGDPVADQAYFRGNMPPDLAMNGRAFRSTAPVLGIDGFWNDTVPRQPGDAGGTPFEVLVTPMNVDMEQAFAAQGVPNTWAIHPGNHDDLYRNAWFRGLEEFAYARLRHADGPGPLVTPPPTVFDYRSISTSFTIWGWKVSVRRQPTEFLTMTGVTCNGLTLHGSGRVTVTPPPGCRRRSVTVDLGHPGPLDEPAGASATPAYGTSRTITLGR